MSDLYNNISELCSEKKVSLGKMCSEIGISRGAMTDLKMGRSKSLSVETLSKISKYLNVTTDYLLERTESPTIKKDGRASDDDIKFALFGTTDIDDELFEDVKRLAKMQKQLKEEKRGK